MYNPDHLDPVTGLLRVMAAHSHTEHLCEPNGHFTLCGRQALYRLRTMKAQGKCKRCQYEASNRPATPASKS